MRFQCKCKIIIEYTQQFTVNNMLKDHKTSRIAVIQLKKTNRFFLSLICKFNMDSIVFITLSVWQFSPGLKLTHMYGIGISILPGTKRTYKRR